MGINNLQKSQVRKREKIGLNQPLTPYTPSPHPNLIFVFAPFNTVAKKKTMLRYKNYLGQGAFPPLSPPPSYTYVKVKVKFTLQEATKAQRGSRGIALFFL